MIVHIETYLRLNLRIGSDTTRKLIRIAHRQFGEYLGREPLMSDLTDDEVAGFMLWLTAGGRTNSTANQKRNYLVSFWRWAHRRKLTEDYPTVTTLPEPETDSPAWTTNELAKLFSACETSTGYFRNGIPQAAFWLAYHRVLLDTAERKSAILDSEWSWYDLPSGLLTVPASARKGKRRRGIYPLRLKTWDSLRDIREPSRRLVFDWPMCPSSFDNHYRKLLERAGLPTDGKHSQRMRRTHASHLAAAGGDATKSLMHSRSSITDRYYMDPRIVCRDDHTAKLPDV